MRYCSQQRTMELARYLSQRKVQDTNDSKMYFKWKLSVLISNGEQRIDVSSYLTPKSPHRDFTWEEKELEYVFKLKPKVSSRRKGCRCVGSPGREDQSFKPEMLLLAGWRAALLVCPWLVPGWKQSLAKVAAGAHPTAPPVPPPVQASVRHHTSS